MPELDQGHVNRLTQVAIQLAARVRDDDPEANGRWLVAALPDRADWFRLAFVLAIAVPDDQTWSELTAWRNGPAKSTGCGTTAGYRRHARAGEPPCDPCKAAERDRGRRRRSHDTNPELEIAA
jgi:hypothetical protein